MKDEPGKIERAGRRNVVGEECGSTGRVLFDGVDDRSSRSTQSGHEEDLDDLEGKVVVLDSQLHSRPSRATRDLGCEAKDDGQQRHEDCKQDDWQQTSDKTEKHIGEVVDERERGNQLDQSVDLGDSTNESDWNCPEDNECDDKCNNDDLADDTLPPLDVQVAPKNFGWCHSSETGLHVQDVVMGQTLIRGLRIIHCRELDKGSSEQLSLPLLVCGLHLRDLRNEPLELAAAEVDGIHLLSDERLQTVDRALLGLEVAGRDGSRFGIGHGDLLKVGSLTLLCGLLVGLQLVGVGSLDELGLGSLQLGVCTITLLDQILELLAVGGEPDAANGRTQHVAQLALAHVVLRDGGVHDHLGGETAGVVGRHEVGLPEVDEEDGFPGDHVDDKAEEEDGTACVGEHLVVVVSDIGHCQDFKLLLGSSAGDVDWEEHGECDDTSNQASDDGDLEEAQEEVAIHGVVLEHVGVGDLVEGLDPVE